MSVTFYKGRSGVWHWCPGCDDIHCVPYGWTFRAAPGGEQIDFTTVKEINPQMEVQPSVRHKWTWGPERVQRICHYFINAGRIAYCGDCWHPLSGQVIDLPPIPDDEIPDGWDQ